MADEILTGGEQTGTQQTGTQQTGTQQTGTQQTGTQQIGTQQIGTQQTGTQQTGTQQTDTQQTGTQQTEQKWFDSLPEGIKGHERLKKYTSQEEALKAFTEAKLQEVPEKYELPAGVHEGWAKFAATQGLTQSQLNSFFGAMAAQQSNAEKRMSIESAAGVEKLFAEWGDKKDENLMKANKVFKSVASGGEALAFIKQAKVASHPVVVKFLADVGKLLDEGGFLKSGDSNRATTNTQEMKYLLFPTSNPDNKT